MKINHQDSDNLVQSIEFLIEPDDYMSQVNAEMKRIKGNAQIKGFRKGKVPTSYIKKLYGDSVKSDVVLKFLNEELNKYLNEKDLDVMLQPLMKNEQENNVDFSIKNENSLKFEFDLLTIPKTELKGLSSDDSYHKYEVEISDGDIDKEIENFQKRFGTQEEVESDIQENDILVLVGKELNEKGKTTADSWDTSFSILVGERMNEETRKELIGKDAGFKFEADVFQLEPELSEALVKKHFLNLDEDEEREINSKFEFIVDEIKRLKPADFDKEVWDKVFGEDNDIENLEDARSRIAKGLSMPYESYINGYLFEAMQDNLMESNDFDIPREFLEAYIISRAEGKEIQDMDRDVAGLDSYLKWEMIKKGLQKKYEINVTEEEIKAQFRQRLTDMIYSNNLQEMLQGMGDGYLDSMVGSMMENKQEVDSVFNSLFYGKVVHKAKEDVTLNLEKISKEDMIAKIEETQAEMQQAQEQAASSEEE